MQAQLILAVVKDLHQFLKLKTHVKDSRTFLQRLLMLKKRMRLFARADPPNPGPQAAPTPAEAPPPVHVSFPKDPAAPNMIPFLYQAALPRLYALGLVGTFPLLIKQF